VNLQVAMLLKKIDKQCDRNNAFGFMITVELLLAHRSQLTKDQDVRCYWNWRYITVMTKV